MLTAEEAESLTSDKFITKCEQRIREEAEGGAKSAVVFGIKDYANEGGINRAISKLESNGYEVERRGANLCISW